MTNTKKARLKAHVLPIGAIVEVTSIETASFGDRRNIGRTGTVIEVVVGPPDETLYLVAFHDQRDRFPEDQHWADKESNLLLNQSTHFEAELTRLW